MASRRSQNSSDYHFKQDSNTKGSPSLHKAATTSVQCIHVTTKNSTSLLLSNKKVPKLKMTRIQTMSVILIKSAEEESNNKILGSNCRRKLHFLEVIAVKINCIPKRL